MVIIDMAMEQAKEEAKVKYLCCNSKIDQGLRVRGHKTQEVALGQSDLILPNIFVGGDR